MHDYTLGSLLAIILFLIVPITSGEQRAKCRTLYPPYAISTDEAHYVSDPYSEGTWDGRMLASKHSNGDESLEILRLSINPGHGWPPHRHHEADEWIYVLSGDGAYAYWAFEEVSPTEISIGPGHALYNPQGQLHMVWNNGTESLALLAVSKSMSPFEVLNDWPETPGGGVGYVPVVAPWEMSCAPGHEIGDEEAPELDQDEAAAWAEEWDGRWDDNQASWNQEEQEGQVEWIPDGGSGELDSAGFSSYGDYGSDPGYYEHESCGCGDGDTLSLSESDVGSCMAAPEMYGVDDDTDVYGGDDGSSKDLVGDASVYEHNEM